jgi:hypothetical protein
VGAAAGLGLGDVLAFHTRSDHQARDVLYTIDHLQRYHAQVGDQRAAEPEVRALAGPRRSDPRRP